MHKHSRCHLNTKVSFSLPFTQTCTRAKTDIQHAVQKQINEYFLLNKFLARCSPFPAEPEQIEVSNRGKSKPRWY